MNTNNNVNVTPDKLNRLFSFEENLESVKVKKEFQLGNNAVMLVCVLDYPEFSMTVPVIYYEGKDWIFTPCDWQSVLPETPEEIGNIDWRINDTETEAVIFNGLPMLSPGTPEPVFNAVDSTRLYIGSVIRQAREEAGLTLRQLSERCEMRFSHLARIERGRNGSNIDTIANIAAALGLKIVLVPNVVSSEGCPPAGEDSEVSGNTGQDVPADNPEKDNSERTDTEISSNASCGS